MLEGDNMSDPATQFLEDGQQILNRNDIRKKSSNDGRSYIKSNITGENNHVGENRKTYNTRNAFGASLVFSLAVWVVHI